jgi:hypothetical protein
MQECHWFTPIQQLGPGARRVANILHQRRRLHGFSGAPIRLRFGELMCCGGAHPMNDTGLALRVKLSSGRTALCLGDAAYDAVPTTAPIDMLVATHHGAAFSGSAPSPTTPDCPCVVSVGKDNVYKHPRPEAVRRHRRAGWSVSYTQRMPGAPRGSRILGP